MQHPLFERILVGVDAEGLATHAVVRGASLARLLGSRLDLVHAVEVPPPLWPGISDSEVAAMHANLLADTREKVVEAVRSVWSGAGLEGDPGDHLRVLPGHPAQVLLKEAGELGSDLVLLGHHARRTLFDFGSTARAVLAKSDCPVWTQGEPVEDVRRILAPVDFSNHSRGALTAAHALAARIGASVHVLHCYTPPVLAYVSTSDALPGPPYVIDRERDATRDELGRLVEEFPWGSVAHDSEFVEGDAVARILEASAGADLVVLGTHGRTGLSRFLLGSVAYAVLKQAEKPVLAIPGPDRTWLLGADASHEAEGARGID